MVLPQWIAHWSNAYKASALLLSYRRKLKQLYFLNRRWSPHLESNQVNALMRRIWLSNHTAMVATPRVELGTHGFSVHCSTNWATRPGWQVRFPLPVCIGFSVPIPLPLYHHLGGKLSWGSPNSRRLLFHHRRDCIYYTVCFSLTHRECVWFTVFLLI